MKFLYTHKAVRNLENLPFDLQKRIAEKMRFYAEQENPLEFAKRLAESREGEFRFRIGDYRVIFDIVKGHVVVLAIRRRDKAYD
ncbi:MAG: type II toxin-antitoxin system RelE/ParE family toxin [bacterium]|nr:type II toxin-antitoxin system RelE/ParE family toxin [bacterium]